MAERVGIALGGGAAASKPPGSRGARGHRLMVPPPGYKFIPRTEQVCQEMGCFECYDIYCERTGASLSWKCGIRSSSSTSPCYRPGSSPVMDKRPWLAGRRAVEVAQAPAKTRPDKKRY
eukprot:g15698.t1